MSTPPIRITLDEVRTTAAMARLALSEEELQQMTAALGGILDYAAKLEEVDVAGVAPTYHAVAQDLQLRQDLLGPQLPVEAALAGAPQQQGGYFVVPAVMDRDRGEG